MLEKASSSLDIRRMIIVNIRRNGTFYNMSLLEILCKSCRL